jgi:FKBP-type peptidyl-prolyl cis-trans isomerase
VEQRHDDPGGREKDHRFPVNLQVKCVRHGDAPRRSDNRRGSMHYTGRRLIRGGVREEKSSGEQRPVDRQRRALHFLD